MSLVSYLAPFTIGDYNAVPSDWCSCCVLWSPVVSSQITEWVIHAQLTNCKLPLKWGSVSIVFPFHLVACYRVLGSEGVCNESKVNITVTY
ncbi:MAG TPA: hypothetical protein VK147_02860 [Candidatus Didemnitutus sp.]|nr:hypothetical protein [Candidatus Didemnitutus sp.]